LPPVWGGGEELKDKQQMGTRDDRQGCALYTGGGGGKKIFWWRRGNKRPSKTREEVRLGNQAERWVVQKTEQVGWKGKTTRPREPRGGLA